MRRVLAGFLLLSLAVPVRAADGPTRRFAVVAGASLGGAGRTPLRYAASDARDVARVLRRLGGVALDDLVLVEEPDADRLRAALVTVAAEADRAHRAGRRVELFVYYSGHSDEEGLLLGTSRLAYADLRHELDRVPADVRVAILDSCASGAITRAKGGVHRPPFLLDESSRVSGHAFLTSSAADEMAQESDRLRASFFTHALLTGLRGAADASADGVVTLNEAYQFAFRETLAGTEALAGGPAARHVRHRAHRERRRRDDGPAPGRRAPRHPGAGGWAGVRAQRGGHPRRRAPQSPRGADRARPRGGALRRASDPRAEGARRHHHPRRQRPGRARRGKALALAARGDRDARRAGAGRRARPRRRGRCAAGAARRRVRFASSRSAEGHRRPSAGTSPGGSRPRSPPRPGAGASSGSRSLGRVWPGLGRLRGPATARDLGHLRWCTTT